MLSKNTKQKIELAQKFILSNDNDSLIKLLKKGLDPNSTTPEGVPLSLFSIKNDKDEAYEIIKDFMSVFKLPKGLKKVCKSIKGNDVNTLKKSLSKGLDPNSKDAKGATLLNLGILSKNTEIVRTLLEFKASDYSSSLPHPFITASQINIEIMKLLLEYKLYDTKCFKNVFLSAARNNNIRIAEILLENNCDISSFISEALDRSAKNGNKEFLLFLLDLGYDVNTLYDDHNVLMLIARSRFHREDIYAKKMELVEYLISNGADLTIENSKKQNALDIARSHKNEDLAELLKSHMTFDLSKITKKLKDCYLPEEVISYLLDHNSSKEFHWPDKTHNPTLELSDINNLSFSSIPIYSWEYRANKHSKKSCNDPNINNDGGYYISAISLVKSLNGYDPSGALIWIPELKQFGTADTTHGVVYIFKDTNWKTIINDLHYYIDYQWNGDNNSGVHDIYDVCNPWELWSFK